MNKLNKKIDNPIIKEINKMAIPLILNSVMGMLIGLIDMAMIGRISLDAFGAVGLISTTINSITGVFGAIAVAFNISGARSKGQGNDHNLVEKFLSGIVLSSLVGIIFWLVTLASGTKLLQIIFGLKGNILRESFSYLKLFSITIGLNMILFMFSSLFKILNRTKYLFAGNITATITNVILNYILIFGKLGFKAMGVKGAGIASVISLFLNIIIYLTIVYRKKLLRFAEAISFIKIIKMGLMLIRNSLALMGQEILESTILVICINAILTRIGVLELSVYTLLLDIVSIMLMPMYAYASTALTLVSKNHGKKDYNKMRIISKYSLLLAMLFCISIAIVFVIFKHYIPNIITNDIMLIKNSVKYFIVALGVYLFNVPNNIYKYSLQGIGDERWVLFNATLINTIGIIIIFVLSIYLSLGITGVYLGLFINYIFLGISNYYRYYHKTIQLSTL